MSVTIEGDRNEMHFYRDQSDAARWRKLMAFVGTPANSSDTIVRLFWDDAMQTPFICVGEECRYFLDRSSFERVIDSIEWPANRASE